VATVLTNESRAPLRARDAPFATAPEDDARVGGRDAIPHLPTLDDVGRLLVRALARSVRSALELSELGAPLAGLLQAVAHRDRRTRLGRDAADVDVLVGAAQFDGAALREGGPQLGVHDITPAIGLRVLRGGVSEVVDVDLVAQVLLASRRAPAVGVLIPASSVPYAVLAASGDV